LTPFVNGGQSLSGSRGDDVWLFGGGGSGLFPDQVIRLSGSTLFPAGGGGSGILDDGVTLSLANGGQIFAEVCSNGGAVHLTPFVNGGQSLSGSRGDDVWLFGGAMSIGTDYGAMGIWQLQGSGNPVPNRVWDDTDIVHLFNSQEQW
jgi:hypothetical protein